MDALVSAQGDHMAASHECAQRGADSRDVSLVSISACSGAASVVVLSAVTDDGFANRRADDLDIEAAYYRDRAIEDKQALTPGYYVDLRRFIAQTGAALARSIRAGSKTQIALLHGKGLGECVALTDHWPERDQFIPQIGLSRAFRRP
jgi:hypothetical protein